MSEEKVGKNMRRKRKSRVLKPRNFNLKGAYRKNVLVKETLWTAVELAKTRHFINGESLPVVKRIQEIPLYSLLSVSIKSIQITTRTARANEITITAYMRKYFEIKIMGYVVWSTHPIYSNKAKNFLTMRTV